MKNNETSDKKARRLIEEKGGIIRTAEALQSGIHPRTLYYLRDTGILEQISRGVYRLAEQEPISNLDFVTVAMRFPKAVICLVSALSYHEITSQVPHAVSIAIAKGAETPRIDSPPLFVHRFSGKSLISGVEEIVVDGVAVRIYSPEKTLADCFKFRNKIGMDVVLEALRLYKSRKSFNLEALLKYAEICRIEKIMKPYLEAMV